MSLKKFSLANLKQFQKLKRIMMITSYNLLNLNMKKIVLFKERRKGRLSNQNSAS